jgi:ubiquinone biosynthesis accessory factor UbiK
MPRNGCTVWTPGTKIRTNVVLRRRGDGHDRTNWIVNGLVRLTENLPASLRAAQQDLEAACRGVLRDAGLGKLDLVSREEFDAQARVLERSRELDRRAGSPRRAGARGAAEAAMAAGLKLALPPRRGGAAREWAWDSRRC